MGAIRPYGPLWVFIASFSGVINRKAMNEKQCPQTKSGNRHFEPINGKAMNADTSPNKQSGPEKLVAGPKLLEILFEEDSRPTLRTLRNWTASKAIPFIRLGHLIFFYPPDVRAALAKKHTINAKGVK